MMMSSDEEPSFDWEAEGPVAPGAGRLADQAEVSAFGSFSRLE